MKVLHIDKKHRYTCRLGGPGDPVFNYSTANRSRRLQRSLILIITERTAILLWYSLSFQSILKAILRMSTSLVSSIHETSSTSACNNDVTQRTVEYSSAAAAASSSMPVEVVEESSSSSHKRKHLESSSDDELRKLQDLVLKLTEENNRLTLRCSTCELENKILKEQNEKLVQTRR